MTNDYGKPRDEFLIQVREANSRTWKRHLRCAELDDAITGAAYLNRIEGRYVYRVKGHPETDPKKQERDPYDVGMGFSQRRCCRRLR